MHLPVLAGYYLIFQLLHHFLKCKIDFFTILFRFVRILTLMNQGVSRLKPILLTVMILSMVTPQTLYPQESVLNLQVMSFNVRYGSARDGKNSWKYRRPIVRDLLRAHQPDIIGTQEALRFQLDEIRNDLNHYGEIGVGREDGMQSGEYAAILYNTRKFKVNDSGTFWFSDKPHIPGTRTWESHHPRICTWALFSDKKTGLKFYLYNVHLDHKSRKSRKKSIEMLLERITNRKHKLPVLVTGDFNVHEKNPLIRYFKGELPGEQGQMCPYPMTDTFRSIHPKASGGTFNLFMGYRYGPKIDFIFADSSSQVNSANIIRSSHNGRFPSDHFPVSAEVVIKN